MQRTVCPPRLHACTSGTRELLRAKKQHSYIEKILMHSQNRYATRRTTFATMTTTWTRTRTPTCRWASSDRYLLPWEAK